MCFVYWVCSSNLKLSEYWFISSSVSFCAGLAIVFQTRKEHRQSRYFAVGLFTILFIAFIIVFGNSLNKWDWNRSGGCYDASLTSTKSARHPHADKMYLIFTAVYMFPVLFWSTYAGLNMKQPDRKLLLKKFVNYPAPIRILIRILLSIALIAITASAKSVTFLTK